MIPSFLDRSAIEAHKAAFGSIERYADPDIQPMPEVVMVAIGNKMQPSKRRLANSMSRTFEPPPPPKKPDARKGRAPANKIALLTGRAIVNKMHDGRSMAQIGLDFDASRSAVSKALRRGLLADAELAVEYSAMLVCGCSRPKMAHQARCIRCRQGRTKQG